MRRGRLWGIPGAQAGQNLAVHWCRAIGSQVRVQWGWCCHVLSQAEGFNFFSLEFNRRLQSYDGCDRGDEREQRPLGILIYGKVTQGSWKVWCWYRLRSCAVSPASVWCHLPRTFWFLELMHEEWIAACFHLHYETSTPTDMSRLGNNPQCPNN